MRSEHEVSAERAQIVRDNNTQLAETAANLYIKISGESDIDFASQRLRESPPWATEFKNKYVALYQTSQQKQGDQLRAIKAVWGRQKERQQKIAKSIGLLSPATAIMLLFTDTVGSGDMAISRYQEAVNQHLIIVDREISMKSATNTVVLQKQGKRRMGRFPGAENPVADNIPQFQVSKPTISMVVASHIWSIATLLVYIIVPILIGYVSFLNYDVR